MRTKILSTFIKSVALVVMAMAVIVCSKPNDDNENGGGYLASGGVPFSYFIANYADTPTSDDEILVWAERFGEGARVIVEVNKQIVDNYGDIHDIWGIPSNLYLAKEKASKFDSLVKAHNDSYGINDYAMGECLYRRTTGIHVVSDSDYDGGHPAGTRLDDMIKIEFQSGEDYLMVCEDYSEADWISDAGERTVFYFGQFQQHGPFLGETTKYKEVAGATSNFLIEDLDEFNQIQRKLICFNFALILTKAPEQTGMYSFTFTYTNEDGVVLNGTTEPITIEVSEE